MIVKLYGCCRAVNQPGMWVVRTIASLGTRVALADALGIGYYFYTRRRLHSGQRSV